jgi:NitT/TauT family transport system substrate-binding protein
MIRIRTGLAFVLALCAAAPALAQTHINLQVAAANDFLPAWAAKEQGFFAKHGLDVDIGITGNPGTLPAALVGDSAQLAIMTGPTLALADLGGLDLVLVAGAGVQTTENYREVLVRPAANIKAPADFKGKKIGTPILNAALDLTFKKWLKEKGVDPRSATFVEVGFAAMADALKTGVVDAVLPVEPFRTRIVQTGSGVSLAPYSGKPGTLLSFYASTRKWADANPKAVEGFRAALREGEAFIKADRAAAKAIEAKYLKLPPQVAEALPFTPTKIEVPAASLQFWFDLLNEFGLANKTVDASAYIVK